MLYDLHDGSARSQQRTLLESERSDNNAGDKETPAPVCHATGLELTQEYKAEKHLVQDRQIVNFSDSIV